MFRRNWFASLPAVFVTGLAIGCGGGGDAPATLSLNPVKGKVLLEDGKPLTGGQVVLVSSTTGMSPTGKIGSDGSFTVNSGAQGEGAPAGEYKVRIEPEAGVGSPGGKPKPGGKLPFSSIYVDEDSSGLKVTVKAGENTLEPFKLSTKHASVAGGTHGGRPAMRD